MDKAAVFIDNGYFSKVLKQDFDQARISYETFSDIICRGCSRFRTYVYDCPPYQSSSPTEEERERKSRADRFYHTLESLPRFMVRLGRLRKVGRGFEQKGVDVLLSVDLVKLSSTRQINRAILVTGDSDFVPAIDAAKETGVLVEVCYSPNHHVSRHLLQSCDDRFHITNDMIEKSLT
ncbi:MAG: NYN domain-containing protein [Methanomassiliicoccales archaeon]